MKLRILTLTLLGLLSVSHTVYAESCFTEVFKATRYDDWNSSKMNDDEEATEVAQLVCSGKMDLETYLKVRRVSGYTAGVDDHYQATKISRLIKKRSCKIEDYLALRVMSQGWYSFEAHPQDWVIARVCRSL